MTCVYWGRNDGGSFGLHSGRQDIGDKLIFIMPYKNSCCFIRSNVHMQFKWNACSNAFLIKPISVFLSYIFNKYMYVSEYL